MDKSALPTIVSIKYIIPPLWRYYSTIKNKIKSISLYFVTYNLYTVFASLFIIVAGGDPLDIRHYDTWVKIGLNILYYRKACAHGYAYQKAGVSVFILHYDDGAQSYRRFCNFFRNSR